MDEAYEATQELWIAIRKLREESACLKTEINALKTEIAAMKAEKQAEEEGKANHEYWLSQARQQMGLSDY